MPLEDITHSENNIPRVLPLKRNIIDDDRTYLPPVLSSYAVSLLAGTKKLPSPQHSQHSSQHSTQHPSRPITGIYELDFPDSTRNSLKNKLTVHFSESKEKEPSKISVLQDSNPDFNMSGHSSYGSMTTMATEYNHEESNASENKQMYSPRSSYPTHSVSIGSISEPEVNRSSSTLQVHSIRKMRGSRKFGKLLGPAKRGVNIQSGSLNDSVINPENPINTVISPRPKTPIKENIPIVHASPIIRGHTPTAPKPLPSHPSAEFDFMSIQKGAELRERIEQQKKLNEIERQRLRQLERLNQLEDIVMIGQEKEQEEVNKRDSMRIEKQDDFRVENKRNSQEEFRKPKTPRVEQPKMKPTTIEYNGTVATSAKTSTSTPMAPVAPVSIPKKKSITINGIQYEKLELLGRGGSSKVYKVKALSNNKLYAIKKVTFDQFDESCVKGFKGEIDLLIKLKHSDRVVKLVDHAIGDGSIYLVMECGDSDLAHVFQSKISMTSTLDLNFVKFHAIEMLKCVLAVHKAGIVHSDLKPANFLFVRGILKIIDFGIANAVPDHTANIYRESQIGTPNYMAPEALVEINQTFPGPDPNNSGSGEQLKNTWRVGMPSDVWSCGCIIYQMIYGKPPYGNYSGNQRIMAIMNPQVRIQYPTTGLGGVIVPTSAIDLMKKCLSRNPNERFTIEQCLNSDFLHPKIVNEDFIRDLVHLAVNFGINNRAGGSGIITADIYDKLVDTVLKQIDDLNYG